MSIRTNLPLSAQQQNAWASTVNPNPREKSAQDALAIMSRFISESRIALRDEVAVIYFPHMHLLSKMHPVTRTKEGDMEYPTSEAAGEDRMNILIRVVNGQLYNHLRQLDCYAHNMATYTKNMRRYYVVGNNSEEGQKGLEMLTSSMLDEAEVEELRATLSLFAIDFNMCYTKPDWRQVVEVTQEMYDAGLTSIVNDWENEKSGWTVTQLNVGDFLVITADGMYTIRREEFIQTHSTFQL